MKLLVKGGTVVTATDTYDADVLVVDESIALIGANLEVDADRVIDAAGNYVLPGGIDPHTHMQLPAFGTVTVDTFTTGTEAAASGGTTTVIDFAVQQPGQEMGAALDGWLQQLADNPPVIDVGFHTILTDAGNGLLGGLKDLVSRGVTSFKLFMAYKGVLMLDDESIFRTLLEAGDLGALVMMHAENGDVINVLIERALAQGHTGPKYHATTRPTLAEAEAAHRGIALAEMADAPVYLVHTSCAEAVHHLADARRRGVHAYGETCPQYLFLDESVYDLPGFEAAKYVFTPPARAREHQAALWRALASDDLVSIGSDHCPFCFKGQKEMGADNFSLIPNGAPGVENRLSLVYDGGVRPGHITLNRMVELLSTAPAKLFGLFPRKGTIAVGTDADLVVFDPERKSVISASTQVTRADYTCFEGREVTGGADTVISRGVVVFENGTVVGKPGHGRFVERSQHLNTLPGKPISTALRVS